jgi:hypothetical protein
MEKEEIYLTAWWNGDTEDWSLTKCPESDSDKLVVITLEVLEPKPRLGYNMKETEKKLKKVSKELRGFSASAKKWSK